MSEPGDVSTARSLKIGLIGLGTMGRGLASSLIRAGHNLTVFDTDPQAAIAVGCHPNRIAEHLPQMFKLPFLMTCLPTLDALRQVYLGHKGWAANAPAGAIAIDCSTSAPYLTRDIARAATARSASMVDAPMLMGPREAAQGTLTLIVGGDKAVLAQCEPIFAAISRRVIHAGPIGSAHALKLLNNSVVMGNHAVLCEAFTLASKCGIDLQKLVDVLSSSRAHSAKLNELAPRLINDDHGLHFGLALAAKDLRLFNSFAAESKVPHSVSESVLRAFQTAIDMGFGDQNVSRLASAMSIEASPETPPEWTD